MKGKARGARKAGEDSKGAGEGKGEREREKHYSLGSSYAKIDEQPHRCIDNGRY